MYVLFYVVLVGANASQILRGADHRTMSLHVSNYKRA